MEENGYHSERTGAGRMPELVEQHGSSQITEPRPGRTVPDGAICGWEPGPLSDDVLNYIYRVKGQVEVEYDLTASAATLLAVASALPAWYDAYTERIDIQQVREAFHIVTGRHIAEQTVRNYLSTINKAGLHPGSGMDGFYRFRTRFVAKEVAENHDWSWIRERDRCRGCLTRRIRPLYPSQGCRTRSAKGG